MNTTKIQENGHSSDIHMPMVHNILSFWKISPKNVGGFLAAFALPWAIVGRRAVHLFCLFSAEAYTKYIWASCTVIPDKNTFLHHYLKSNSIYLNFIDISYALWTNQSDSASMEFQYKIFNILFRPQKKTRSRTHKQTDI